MRPADPLFRREWSSVYEALQDCRPDAGKIDATIHLIDVTSGTPSIGLTTIQRGWGLMHLPSKSVPMNINLQPRLMAYL